MPLPSDVSTFTLQGGPYTDAAGYVVASGVTGTLVPVDGNLRPTQVVHTADGATIVPESVLITIGAGGTWSVAGLAHTDDPHLSPTGFLYQVTWKLPAYRASLVNKLISVPVASGPTADYDLLAPTTTTTGVAVNQASVLSVAGHTGIVTVAQLKTDLAYADALKPTAVKTTTYSAVLDDLVLADGMAAGFTVTLPTAPAVGALVAVKKVDATTNVITVAPAAGGTIDGDANATIVAKGAGAVFQHAGSNAWQIVAVTSAPGPGVPVGGTTGQVLAKTSNTDYATGWTTVAATSDATTSTKGILQLAGDLAGTAAAPTVTGGTHHTHTAAQVSDSTTVGRAVLTAVDAAAARAATGAGTSNLAIGTTGTTAAAGNDSRLSDTRTPTDASVTDVKVATGAAINADKLTDGTALKVMTAAERTKLAGLATVATSGAYTDLSGKPTIPTVGAAGAGAAIALSSTDSTVTNARTPTAHASTHASAGSDPVTLAATQVTGLAIVSTSGSYTDLTGVPGSPALGASLPNSVETVSRVFTRDGTSLVSGTLTLTYFTSPVTLTVGNVRTSVRTSGSASATLARVGLYSVSGAGALTLLAATTSDATLWNTTFTSYTRTLNTSIGLTAGTRYAMGILCVGPTLPNLYSWAGLGADNTMQPRYLANLPGQTDLPSTIADSALATSGGSMFYGVFL